MSLPQCENATFRADQLTNPTTVFSYRNTYPVYYALLTMVVVDLSTSMNGFHTKNNFGALVIAELRELQVVDVENETPTRRWQAQYS